MKRLFYSITILFCLYFDSACASRNNIVFAHYMHCYILGHFVGTMPSNPSNLASWPPSEMYARSWWPNSLNNIAQNRTAESIDLSLASTAGIDVFSVLISPTNIQSTSAYLPGLTQLAQAASSTKTKLIPDIWFDESTPPCSAAFPCDAASWSGFGTNVQTWMNANPSAFYKQNGKWVIVINPLNGNSATYSQFVHFFDPWGGLVNFIILARTDSGIDQSTWQTSGWSSAAQYTDMWSTGDQWGSTDYQTLLIQAGFNPTPLAWPAHSFSFFFRPGVAFIAENFGVSNIVDQWKYAISNSIPFADLQSWNDFTEDHAITQTNTKGQTLIHITRYFSDWFKTGKQPTITKDRIFLFYRRQLTTTTLTNATQTALIYPQITDCISVVSMLTQPGTLHLRDGSLKVSLSVPAGFHEWLVYAPTSANPFPTSSATRTVTGVTSIPASLPSLTLTRNSTAVATVTGPAAIASTAQWQDMSMVGAESTDTNPSVPY
jgi:Glycosyl hydrolase family 71